jgi:5-methylthioadenosine/S-adenosylhomocysteine deaminase
MVDILIHQGAVLTESGWEDPAYLAILDGKIYALGAGNAPDELLRSAAETITAKNQAVIPGLTNAHTHLSQVFMRGLAGGKGLLDWLSEIIWPLQQVISPDDIYLAAQLGLAENIRSGVTDVVDHHKITGTPEHTDRVIQAASEAGVNFRLARAWSDVGKNSEEPDAILSELERLLVRWQDHPSLGVDSGPLALWRCSADTLQQAHQLVKSFGRKTHFHVSETSDEVNMSLESYGVRPVEWLDQVGVLDEDTELVHGVWLEDQEIDLIAAAGASLVHCPVSNAVLGSGIAPLHALLEAGVNLRLGTDGPASNDTQDIWETAKFALCLARISTQNPTLLPPDQLLSLAVGKKRLRAGAQADLILVDLDHPRLSPLQDYSSTLMLAGRGDDVVTVIASGKLIMSNRKILTLDEHELLQESRSRITELRKKAKLDK